MSRYVCIHGHFYQPPRENPSLGVVELQESAHPFHDWNERITAECYAPNSAARILDKNEHIIDIVNNYSVMSFNFGPTLLSWLEIHKPDVYRAVLQADKTSQKLFSGHGAALAQSYNHMIMPLANSRDKRTQTIWGIADFKHRFGRDPEGMWLPETAVDLETLGIMAELGIEFTILSPYQARRMRRIGDENWTDVKDGRIDPRRPYVCMLPSGRRIHLFFYNWPLSHDIAFGDILESGSAFAGRLIDAFSDTGDSSQLVHVASDGETYGHHHRFAEMALAFCMREIETKSAAAKTIYGEFLRKHPAEYEVDIIENTSWSCIHGVERWRANCGCSTGKHTPGSQEWRAPLREAMDWLKEKVSAVYEKVMGAILDDPWKARDDYITVVLNRSEPNVNAFFSRHASRKLSSEEKIKALKLLEIQKNAMLMYTSCGWFFDEISRIETIQVMRYAGRAIQLLRMIGEADLESGYIALLEKASSSEPGLKNGAYIYEKFVKTALYSILQVGVNSALSTMIRKHVRREHLGHHIIYAESQGFVEREKLRLSTGRLRIKDQVTLDEEAVCYAVLDTGGFDYSARVRQCPDEKECLPIRKLVEDAVGQGSFSEALELMGKHFEGPVYSLAHLFKDGKRRLLDHVLHSALKEAEASFRNVFEAHSRLLRTMEDKRIPMPEAFGMVACFVLNSDLHRWGDEDEAEGQSLRKLMRDFKRWSCEPDRTDLSRVSGKKLDSLIAKLSRYPQDIKLAGNIANILKVLKGFPLGRDLWRSQNIFYSIWKSLGHDMESRAAKGDVTAKKWLSAMRYIGTRLGLWCA
ncbi:MAG: DUF3536 domain-containing protein [Candidatus Aminicenantes bacterium]|nr:DUF3536 domain-containing protein [Candidatus Aminicenantes bacterium]